MDKYKKIVKSIVLILLLFLIQSAIQIKVNGETINDNRYIESNLDNKKTYKIGSDIVFKGAFSSNSTYFNINKWWEINEVKADVKFSINQLANKESDSYISFSVNGVPFYSQQIYYDSSIDIQEIKVNIPNYILKEGNNEFKLETYLRNTDLPCVDDVNTANWITIKANSSVEVNFSNNSADNKISNFPYPYLKENDNENAENAIVIPNDYTDGELSAALLLNSYMSKLYGSKDYNGKIYKYDDCPKNEFLNYIYIGNYKTVPKEINLGNTENQNCEIRVTESPYTDKINTKIMAIISNAENMLTKSVNTLMNSDILMQLNSDTFSIDDNLKEEIKEIDEDNKITFKDMGVDEINLKGPFRRSANISYSLPKNKALGSGDKIKIFMRYSENLDFDRSLVTIYINGTPIGSKKLEKDKGENDELELVIPDDIKLTNYMDIKIAFDLELINSYCEKREEEMPWALVTGDSYIYSALTNIDNYEFSTYGAPFISDRRYNDALIVIPDNLTSKDLNSICGIFSYLGKDLSYNSGSLKVIRSSNLKGEEENNNLIIYGTPKNNKLIKKINDTLWFKYDDEYSKFLSNEKLFLTDPYSSEISIFQLDISPFNEQKAMLVLTSIDENILRDSLKYLSSSEKIYELNGDSAVLDKYGNIKTFKFKKIYENPVYSRIENLDGNSKIMLLLILMFIIFGATSGILYYLKNKKQITKNYSEKNNIKNIDKK